MQYIQVYIKHGFLDIFLTTLNKQIEDLIKQFTKSQSGKLREDLIPITINYYFGQRITFFYKMSLSITTNSMIGVLNQYDIIKFTNKDLSNALNICSARISEVLNVLTGACLISKLNRHFVWQRRDLQQAFAEFAYNLSDVGIDNSIFQHTRTVVFKIKNGIQLDKERRTYDVLVVLKTLGVIVKKQNWEFTTVLVKPILLNLTSMQENETRVQYVNFNYEFECD